MSTKSWERGWTWGGTAVAAAAALAFALVSGAGAGGEESEKKIQIKLVVDRDGATERVTLEDLHEMSVGETRALTAESGSPVLVTRDEEGFEVDVSGKKIRVMERFSSAGEDGGRIVQRKVVVGGSGGDGGEDGGTNAFVFHSVEEGENDVVILHREGPDGDAFGWATDGVELAQPTFGIEGTIARLEKSAQFQELDAATRAKVVAALRASAPRRVQFDKATGAQGGARKVMVLEVEDDEN